ncbi:ABC transporter ATP-binding protein (plasmid) [Rhodococcus globerulus]|uniref:ABC transporter ATP-binding protein n=1 Tax=Rhodococcus globerulus TaxID=33008 RepID=UPI0039E8ECA3
MLQDLSLAVDEGTVGVLLGRNGVGKTTTLRSVMGLTPGRSGSVIANEQDITRLSPEKIAHAGVALVPQGRGMFESLTVREHLSVFARSFTTRGSGSGRSANSGSWDFDEVLKLFPRLGERLSSRGTDLSGGEQQMLAIGRALITNPRLLLLDEPTEGLSPAAVREVVAAIRALRSRGDMTILLVEQNLSLALELADHIYVMNKGSVVFDGSSQDLKGSVDIQERFLGL